MPNSTFDPSDGCSGWPGLTALDAGPIIPSALGKDYCLVQSTDRITDAWRAALVAAGATILEVHPEDAVQVSVPDGQCAALALAVPDVGAVCSCLPSHAPFGQLMPLFDPVTPSVPADLRDADGSILLVAGLQVGENPATYLPPPASFPCAVTSEAVMSPLPAAATAPGQLRIRVANGGDVACVRAVVEWLARLEAAAVVLAQPTGRNAMDGSNWFVQTGTSPPLVGPPYSATTTKLFANGISGVGQVVAVADLGIDNDACAFTYGPYVSDATPCQIDFVNTRFVPPWAAVSRGSTNPADMFGRATGWRPGNKLVANYCLSNNPPYQGGTYCAEASDPHGSVVAGCAAGDDFTVSAARAGVVTDDPREDEAALNGYGFEIEHHDAADGSAPGAQIIMQKVDYFWTGETYAIVDILRQAYDTDPGARAHANAQGRIILSGSDAANASVGYTTEAAQADGQLYRLRDFVMTLAAGNPDQARLPPEAEFATSMSACKNCISVAATAHATDAVLSRNMMDASVSGGEFVSGHGPGFPFQMKPDVCVPGEGLTVHSSSGIFEDGTGSGDGGCAYITNAAGTSEAAPTVAGLALDIRQYFMDGFYGGGAPNPGSQFIPTNALLKAVLINSARNLAGGAYTGDYGPDPGDRPTFGQGWGAVTLDDTLFFIGDSGDLLERRSLIVLNDVPNGLTNTSLINDRRAEILDDFKPAIKDGQIHEFEIWPKSTTDDLHVTLTWSDVEGNPGATLPSNPCPSAFTGQPPLRNDLDLEVVAPDGKVWRSRAGGWCGPPPIPQQKASTDPDRLWLGGFSTLGTAGCPGLCGSRCPGNEFEQDNEQGSVPAGGFCDFLGRDRRGTVENVFIRAADVIANGSPYRVRVIGYDVQGNGRTAAEARPNFVNADGLSEIDVISDLDQGYALIASGDLMTAHGHMGFIEREPICSGEAKLFMTTRVQLDPLVPGMTAQGDATVGRVVVTASSGDCDEFELLFWQSAGVPGIAEGYAALIASEPLPAVIDPATFGCGASRVSPTGALLQGNGTVQVDDDGWISARLEFPGIVPPPMQTLSAGTRTSCRDVILASAVIDDGCDDLANGALNPGELAWVDIELFDVGSPAVAALWGRLLCKDRNVTLEPTSVVFTTSGGIEARALLRADAALAGVNCPTSVRFELELFGEDGFRDRVFFDVPVDCTPDVTAPLARPGEVPGPAPDSLFVRKAGIGQVDLALTWGPAPQPSPTPVPPYVYTYDIWEGDVRRLVRNGYSHVLPAPPFGLGNDFCHVPLPTLTLPAFLPGRAGVTPDHYYLVTARIQCASGLASLDGPWGHPDRDGDGQDDAEEIPAGRRLDPACP